jgi:hypothetical protein
MRRVPSSLIAVNLDGRTATPIRDGNHRAVWNELFPAEQARIVQLLVERVNRPGGRARGADQGRGSCELGRGPPGGEEGGMMNGIEAQFDGSTLIVRIPMRFQRRGGRKRIVAPDGSEIAPTTKPQPDGTLVKALARAHRWQKMLDEGVYTGLAELADAERINRSYVCRALRLTLLAPEIVERILDGRPTVGLPQLMKPFPVEWERQRERFC